MHRVKSWQQGLYQAGFILLGLFVLVPMWMIVQMAFDGSLRGWPLELHVIPKQFTLEVFAQLWQRVGQSLTFLQALRNSLIVSGGAMLLSVACGATMAYAFARYRFAGRRIGLYALMIGALLPPVALMTPLYILLTILHLRTSLLGLVIVYTAFSMPFAIWNMRTAFMSVGKDLEEAAFLDGAGPFHTFLRINFPLALPSIAIAGLLAFLAGYTEFAMAWLFIDKGENVTLAMALSGMMGVNGGSWNMLAALAILMSLPVVLIFVFLQRYILNSLLLGKMKE